MSNGWLKGCSEPFGYLPSHNAKQNISVDDSSVSVNADIDGTGVWSEWAVADPAAQNENINRWKRCCRNRPEQKQRTSIESKVSGCVDRGKDDAVEAIETSAKSRCSSDWLRKPIVNNGNGGVWRKSTAPFTLATHQQRTPPRRRQPWSSEKSEGCSHDPLSPVGSSPQSKSSSPPTTPTSPSSSEDTNYLYTSKNRATDCISEKKCSNRGTKRWIAAPVVTAQSSTSKSPAVTTASSVPATSSLVSDSVRTAAAAAAAAYTAFISQIQSHEDSSNTSSTSRDSEPFYNIQSLPSPAPSLHHYSHVQQKQPHTVPSSPNSPFLPFTCSKPSTNHQQQQQPRLCAALNQDDRQVLQQLKLSINAGLINARILNTKLPIDILKKIKQLFMYQCRLITANQELNRLALAYLSTINQTPASLMLSDRHYNERTNRYFTDLKTTINSLKLTILSISQQIARMTSQQQQRTQQHASFLTTNQGTSVTNPPSISHLADHQPPGNLVDVSILSDKLREMWPTTPHPTDYPIISDHLVQRRLNAINETASSVIPPPPPPPPVAPPLTPEMSGLFGPIGSRASQQQIPMRSPMFLGEQWPPVAIPPSNFRPRDLNHSIPQPSMQPSTIQTPTTPSTRMFEYTNNIKPTSSNKNLSPHQTNTLH